ncbi:MAG: 30S ribosomal protein S4e [Candidatus Diapherotrites archaeon]|nr:30S ribosomal protein S4e [Candidatus Diapherotrites archaeon]
MASKGQDRTLKRLAAKPILHVHRKRATFAIRSKPGPHSMNTSIPLGFVIRDLAGLSKNMKETKAILNAGLVQVDESVRKDAHFPVGLFDVVDIASMKARYVLGLDTHGRAILKKTAFKEGAHKIKRVEHKTMKKGGVIQLQFNDGHVYVDKKNSLRVGDSAVVDLKSKKIVEEVPLKPGAGVFVIGGNHVGETARVNEIIPGTMRRKSLVKLSRGQSLFQTVSRNLIPVDKHTLEWLEGKE